MRIKERGGGESRPGDLPSIISDKCLTTVGRQSLRYPQVSMNDEGQLLSGNIRGSTYVEDKEDKKQEQLFSLS